MSSASPPAMPTWREAIGFWLKLGWISFGGPAGQVALMHRELVEKRKWISEGHFLHALNFCMLLPGPEAQQLATYLGWRLHGWRGGLAAGGLFVLPSVLLLYGLSVLYVTGGHLPWLAGCFHGLQAVIIAVIVDAVIRIGRKALRVPVHWGMAVAAFVAIRFFGVSFVWVIAAAALIGAVGYRWCPRGFPATGGHQAGEDEGDYVLLPGVPRAGIWRTTRILVVGGLLWWVPVLLCGWGLGWESAVAREGVFFSKAAMITFGGAYAVLPYVAQQAVERFGWLSQGQMMSGLALAETTPGPLIMVLQFVGFVGGWQHPGVLSPWVAATLGALLTTWVTFVPCFIWIFLGGPQVEHLRQRPTFQAALSCMTAAVVGVILNLAVQFGMQAIFPKSGGVDGLGVMIAVLGGIALIRFKLGLIPVIVGAGAVGLIARLAGWG